MRLLLKLLYGHEPASAHCGNPSQIPVSKPANPANPPLRQTPEFYPSERRKESAVAQARAGEDIVIEDEFGPIARLSPTLPQARTISECIALLSEDSTGIMDEDSDVAAAIGAHREPLNPPARD